VARAARVLSRFGGVYFLGDSITQQQFGSLRTVFPHEGAPFAIDFVRDDGALWERDGVRSDWTNALTPQGPFRLLVMNRGVHYVPDETVVTELNATLAALRARLPDVLVIWRASVVGTAGCTAFTGEPPLADFSRLAPRESWPFHWAEIQDQNALARALIREHHPHVLILDPAAPSLLRASSRVGNTPPRADNDDCLHWAMPAAPDMWNVAMVEALAVLETIVAESASACCPAANGGGGGSAAVPSAAAAAAV